MLFLGGMMPRFTRTAVQVTTHLLGLPLQRVQDSIVEWVKQDNWQRIVAEKRSVLACMHQVQESSHTLLDTTHIPVDGIVRLLQHILRSAAWVARAGGTGPAPTTIT